ncbi:MAG: peroxidase [Candidatus Solibacter sp.]|nr:peroxidase [Candidatus Solibacter sp.]
MPDSLLGKLTEYLGQNWPWYKQPLPLALASLVDIRDELRAKNLYDTEEPPFAPTPASLPVGVPAGVPAGVNEARTADGTYNDLHYPAMGSRGCRFGRNFPLDQVRPDTANLMTPNPREVSLRLLARREFQAAGFLNLLTATWIQFMVHDWFVHRQSATEKHEIPIGPRDNWPDHPMTVTKSEISPAPAGSTHPPAFINDSTHWWDASQLYGSDAASAANVRSFVEGKLKIGADGKMLLDPVTGSELTGFEDNGWVGLSMLHGLFVAEHNAICDMLKSHYPQWTDETLYDKARLINVALIAKIHTVEWTPAILPNPITQRAMHTNWYGLAGDDLQDVFKFLNESEVMGGIPGSETDHHSAPYSLTEEFVSVYRMHALIPDEFDIRSAETGEPVARYELPQVFGRRGRDVMAKLSLADLFYSFGTSHPGAVRLHNFPNSLRDLRKDDGTHLDLAAIDVLRDRERGVPRYNQFRRLLRKPAVTSFEELTGDTSLARELREVYGGDLEMVDLMVGLYAEPLPEGFGFSETAFRIFVLMASRRLKSDRFFTADYTPEMYTPEGMEWIRANGMFSVLRRHVPQVAAAFEGVENPFAPWKTATAPAVKAAASS